MNPYYYLFYKFSRFLNKKGDNEWGVIFAISIIVIMNIIFIYVISFHITQDNSQGIYKIIIGILFLILFITNAILFLNKARVNKILNRYKGESETSRKVGNVMVILYIALSLTLIIFI